MTSPPPSPHYQIGDRVYEPNSWTNPLRPSPRVGTIIGLGDKTALVRFGWWRTSYRCFSWAELTLQRRSPLADLWTTFVAAGACASGWWFYDRYLFGMGAAPLDTHTFLAINAGALSVWVFRQLRGRE